MYNKKRSALVTGASSGIGKAFAKKLAKDGFFVIISGRRMDALNNLQKELGKDCCAVIPADLSTEKGCIDLYARVKPYNIDMLINNAGFGLFGEFTQTSLSKELEMIDVNIKAMHILFKLFLKDFVKRDSGYILNVASSAGMLPGPLMSTYYSSKSYVIRQTQAVREELRRKKSKVCVSVLCPGPVNTNFNNNAGVDRFTIHSISAEECAEYALKMLKKRRLMIMPTLTVKLLAVAVKVVPAEICAVGAYFVVSGKKR